MSPRSLKSDGGTDKHKGIDASLTELASLRGLVTALKGEKADCDRIINMLDGITEPLLILDDASQIIYANSAAGRLFDIRHEKLPGKRLWDVYPESKESLFYNVFMKSAKNSSPASFIEILCLRDESLCFDPDGHRSASNYLWRATPAPGPGL